MRAKLIILVILPLLMGCLTTQKQRHAPNDENLRYMYVTVYPDESNLLITVEFKDNTPAFRDSRLTKEMEPISFSIDQRKVKLVRLNVSKAGWVTQEKTWNEEVPFDVFIKLNTVP